MCLLACGCQAPGSGVRPADATAAAQENPWARVTRFVSGESSQRKVIGPQVPPASPDDLSLSKKAELSPTLLVALAQRHEQSGNLQAAQQEYDRALAKQPDHLDALLGLARFYDRQGKFKEATRYYTEATRRHPNHPTTHNDLALCLARQGRFEEAAASLQKAVQLRPEAPLYRNNLATVLVELRRYDEALRQLQQVHPPAVAHYNLGYLLAQNEQFDEARRHYGRAVELDPHFAAARLRLAELNPSTASTPQSSPGPNAAGGAPAARVSSGGLLQPDVHGWQHANRPAISY
jgi:tetratricopeptide (TPR) repeat protein